MLLQNVIDRYKDLIAIETVHTLNAALCDYHKIHCPASEQLRQECDRVMLLYRSTKAAVHHIEANFDCMDHYVSARQNVPHSHVSM